jgi:hypothetical protein
LQDVCLLAEVAELAQTVAGLAEEHTPNQEDKKTVKKTVMSRRGTMKKDVGSVRFENISEDEDDVDDTPGSETLFPRSTKEAPEARPVMTKELSRTTSGTLRIKSSLDRWDEPVQRIQKMESSIKDVLRFRHAIALMDESNPFGEAFGSASTRDECIESAVHVYWRLMKLTPDAAVLPYDTLTMLTEDGGSFESLESSTEEQGKKLALKKFFRPDRRGNLPLLSFTQSCDSLYRRLRYFRASVTNASAIDTVLEDILDRLFGFVLSLVILSLLNVNP